MNILLGGLVKILNYPILTKQDKLLNKIVLKMILQSSHLYYGVYKLSKNFTEGNTRSFLRWLLCDVMKSRGDHARIVSTDQCNSVASLERLRRRRNRVCLVCLTLQLLLAILRHTFGDENLK